MGYVEDIDARLDELTSAIHETITASASKRQPAKQPLLSIPPTIIANIREKNRLRRDWQISRYQELNQSTAKVDWLRDPGVEERSMV